MACLDTCVLVDLMRRGRSARRRRAESVIRRLAEKGEVLVTTRFSQAELYVGVERSRDPDRERAAVDAALANLLILEFDHPAARLFAQVTAYLQQLGQAVGDMDVLIAAVAMVNGHSIVSRNARHFEQIPGLRIEDY